MSKRDCGARQPIHAGGMDGLLAQMETRRDPLGFGPGESLPPFDADLDALARQIVPKAETDPLQEPQALSSHHRKLLELRAELVGSSELAVLHGLLVAHLRKRSQPAHCAALFVRLWTEQAPHLLTTLDLRWQVSAATTFADHGQSPVQRQVGSALSVLFGMMKLYETERRFSGRNADQPFPLDRLQRAPLPLDMDPFCIASGGLDVNMVGRIWQEACGDATIRPLAHSLLDQVMDDPRTIFRRLRIMRQRRARRRGREAVRPDEAPAARATTTVAVPARAPGPVTWGVVCTTNATLSDILPWAAHHLDLGAHRLRLFLDAPDPETMAFFHGHPRVEVTQCNAAFWAGRGKPRPAAHQLRQAHNATLALRGSDVAYLAHVDIDEFLISADPVADILATLPPDAAFARVKPVELLAPLSGPPRHFKRAHKHAGQPRHVLETLFPTYGAHLASGLISHTVGKVFARTGLAGTRLGVHVLKKDGAEVTNGTVLPNVALAHLHARDAADFVARTTFRLDRGSYRKGVNARDGMQLFDLLTFLRDEEGTPGLRAFFREVCTARPDLLSALDAHGMLLTHDLHLAHKVARVFGVRALRSGAA